MVKVRRVWGFKVRRGYLEVNYKSMKLTVSWGTTTDVLGTLNPTPRPPTKPGKGKQVQGVGLKGLGLMV